VAVQFPCPWVSLPSLRTLLEAVFHCPGRFAPDVAIDALPVGKSGKGRSAIPRITLRGLTSH
jgi:hypothetical protein